MPCYILWLVTSNRENLRSHIICDAGQKEPCRSQEWYDEWSQVEVMLIDQSNLSSLVCVHNLWAANGPKSQLQTLSIYYEQITEKRKEKESINQSILMFPSSQSHSRNSIKSEDFSSSIPQYCHCELRFFSWRPWGNPTTVEIKLK